MKILVISAHPDDETLGMGGTILKHNENGDKVYWLIVTEAHKPRWSKEMIERKAKEVERVADAYQAENYFKLGFPSAMLDTIPNMDLIVAIKDVIAKVKPETIYLVHEGDIHTDHREVFTATMSSIKPYELKRLGIQRVISYETLSSTNTVPPNVWRSFTPNVFNDVTPYIEKKIEIMKIYETEAQDNPLPRGDTAIRALGRYRGSTIGVDYAEAFMLLYYLP